MDEPGWNAVVVGRWVESRIEAARADQVAAERGGRERRDDCDKAAAEELVCTALRCERVAASRAAFLAELTRLQGRDDHVWRGVYDDDRFDRHVRSCVRKLVKMAKAGTGFENVRRYQ